MPSTLENLSPTRVKITVDKPFAELESAIAAAYRSIANQVNIPGFRKGKVPPRLIDQRFGRNVVIQEALNSELPALIEQSVTDNSLQVLSEPKVDIVEINDNTNVVLTIEFSVVPEFEIVDPASISVEVEPAEVSDEQVNERIDLLRERFATCEPVDRAAKEGDEVELNLTAYVDGEAIDDGHLEDHRHVIGRDDSVDGLDDALTGMSKGETARFTTTLLGGSHAQQEAEVEVEVLDVNERTLPEPDDEFAQLISSLDTFEEMKDDLRTNLERGQRAGQLGAARNKVLEQIVAKTSFELPEDVVKERCDEQRERLQASVRQANMSTAEFLSTFSEEFGVEVSTEEEAYAEMDRRVETNLRGVLILDKLVLANKYEVSQEEITSMIFQRAQAAGTSPDEVVRHMMDHGHAREWIQEMRRDKALTDLARKATITDTNGVAVDLSSINPDGTVAEPQLPVLEGELVPDQTAPVADKADKAADTAETADEETPAKKPAAKKPAAKKTAKDDEAGDAKPATKKTPAKKATAKKPAAKKSAEQAESGE